MEKEGHHSQANWACRAKRLPFESVASAMQLPPKSSWVPNFAIACSFHFQLNFIKKQMRLESNDLVKLGIVVSSERGCTSSSDCLQLCVVLLPPALLQTWGNDGTNGEMYDTSLYADKLLAPSSKCQASCCTSFYFCSRNPMPSHPRCRERPFASTKFWMV